MYKLLVYVNLSIQAVLFYNVFRLAQANALSIPLVFSVKFLSRVNSQMQSVQTVLSSLKL